MDSNPGWQDASTQMNALSYGGTHYHSLLSFELNYLGSQNLLSMSISMNVNVGEFMTIYSRTIKTIKRASESGLSIAKMI